MISKLKLKEKLRENLVIKKILIFLVFVPLISCSLNPNSKFWTKEKKILLDKSSIEVQISQNKKILNEFNSNFKISLPKTSKKFTNHLLNNDGHVDFEGNLQNMSKYNFKKIKLFTNFEPEILMEKNHLFYFDNNGSIIKFDEDSNLLWKKNHYSKFDKKLQPILFFGSNQNDLFVIDSIANYYAINKNTGDLKWKKRHTSSFNSQVKIFEDKALVIDMENSLRCISIENGEILWTIKTEESLLRSQKKQSLIINKNFVYFSNSVGDVTAVNIKNGEITWQTPTQSSISFGSTFFLKSSDLISDGNSIFFSNNNNQFFSIDLLTGTINWKQDISSELRSALIGNFIITITDDGLLVVLKKDTGEIIRVNSIFKNIKNKKKKNFKPVGFLIGKHHIFLTTHNGRICVINFKEGKIEKMLKLDKNKLQRPIYLNKHIYIAKDNSIIKIK